MKKQLMMVLVLATAVFSGCSTNPHKAKKVDSKVQNDSHISGDTKIGVNKDGNMVVQKKVVMNEDLRRLQNDVYSLEDKVYGSRKYGSRGLYGALKTCRLKLSKKKYGGDGKLTWTEPIARVIDREEEGKVGLDDNNKIVRVSEEFLKDRIERFKVYKKRLQKREDEYKDKLEICDAQLDSRMHDLKKKKHDLKKHDLKNESN